MTPLLNESISTILQLIVFSVIPFLFFLFKKDKSLTFFKYIGLYEPTRKSIIYVIWTSLLFVIAGIGLTFIDESIKQAVLSPNSVTGKLRLMGLNATSISILLIIALFKTSLAEEILFRGFIAKQLINKLGFITGNILQAAIFGIIHLLLFLALTNTTFIPLTFIFVFSSFAGWTIGYIKNKYANGSIIPGWIAHGLGNTISYFIIAFFI
ncbi:MAG: CPBP family intramembrane metalloprotease [Bacteroidota bacterium]|nr:CPBP family intramembrane metalloprotease [Bacteroidota bacterium]